METTTVTSKGQVTIPKEVRQRFGIRQGSKLEFTIAGDHVEIRLASPRADVPKGGFGMLKTKHPAVSPDFDPASLLHRKPSAR